MCGLQVPLVLPTVQLKLCLIDQVKHVCSDEHAAVLIEM